MAEENPALIGTADKNKPAEKEKKTLFDVINEWTMARKLSLVAAAAVSILLFSLIIMQARVADYSLLFANLPSRDASEVVEWLKARKIPYRLEGGGSMIMIPADQVYETRLELAGSGLAESGVGFEIFDKQSFGMTDFTQKVNYRRALQGELTRTITSLAPVEAARIHLALPEKRLFREQQQPATASVIIKLAEGRTLREAQIQGIVHLVAGSVEGLEAEQVTVVDSSGRTLSASRGDESFGPTTPGMQNYQQTMESRLEHRAQTLLDRALGMGNSLVRVTAEVDFDQRERVEEVLDPRGAVPISEQTMTEEGSGQMVGGVPGVVANLEEGQQAAVTSTPSRRSEEVVNYELSKVVSKTVQSVGSVKNLSVSVLVADRVTPGAEGGEPVTSPRSPEEVQEIEQMVRTALGLSDDRGDVISVVSMPFESAFGDDFAVPPPSLIDRIYPLMPVIKYSLLGIAALLAYLLLIRPIIRTLRSASDENQPMKTVEELENELRGETPMLGGPGDPLSQIRQEVLGGNLLAAQVIKNWMKNEPVES